MVICRALNDSFDVKIVKSSLHTPNDLSRFDSDSDSDPDVKIQHILQSVIFICISPNLIFVLYFVRNRIEIY